MLALPDWAVSLAKDGSVIGGIILFFGLLITKVFRPMWKFIKKAADTIETTGEALEYVQSQMKNNAGKSIRDVVERTERSAASSQSRLEHIEHHLARHDVHLDRLGGMISAAITSSTDASAAMGRHTEEEMARHGAMVSMLLRVSGLHEEMIRNDKEITATQDTLDEAGIVPKGAAETLATYIEEHHSDGSEKSPESWPTDPV